MRELVSIEGEQAVIGTLLRYPECADKVFDKLTPDDFTDWRHIAIVSAVSALYGAGKQFDAVTVCEVLNTPDLTGPALQLASEAMSPVNINSYCDIVKERSRFRSFSSAASQVAQLVNDSETYDEAISEAQSILINLETQGSAVGDPECSATVLTRYIKDLDRRFRSGGGIDGLETGFKDIDERWMGMKPGQLIVLAARPSMGKSLMAMQIVEHNAINHKKNCMVFSLEMTSEELSERMIASVGRIPYSQLKDATLFADYSSNLSMAAQKIKVAPIQYIDRGMLHINQMCAISRKSHRRKPLDLIMVDHISIMQGDGQSREREMADITGKLKALAKELKIPILALCQLNRGVEKRDDKRPMMSDLRDSGSIEQDADIVQMVYRHDYYHKPDGDESTGREGVIDLFTRKFRGGMVGDDVLTNNFGFMRMENYCGQAKSWDEMADDQVKAKEQDRKDNKGKYGF